MMLVLGLGGMEGGRLGPKLGVEAQIGSFTREILVSTVVVGFQGS